MGAIADRVRGALGRQAQEPPPAEPEPRPINIRAEYVRWARIYLESFAAGAANAAVSELYHIRRFAHLNGHGEAFDRIWVEPKTNASADGRWIAWYRQALGHRLEPERVADPGPEPLLPDNPLFWRERYAACAFEVLAAYRAQDLRRAHFADVALQNVLREAWGRGFRGCAKRVRRARGGRA